MIVGNIKPLPEIVSAIEEYKQVLILGCGSCVTVCLSGGEREAEQLSGFSIPSAPRAKSACTSSNWS